MKVFPGNSTAFTLSQLRNRVTRELVSGADVKLVEILDASNNPVAGAVYPLVLAPISDRPGAYKCVLPQTVEFTAGQTYHGEITVDNGEGMFGRWKVSFEAEERIADGTGLVN